LPARLGRKSADRVEGLLGLSVGVTKRKNENNGVLKANNFLVEKKSRIGHVGGT